MPENAGNRELRRLLGSGGRRAVTAIGLVVGVVVGAIFYGASQLHGLGLDLLIGAVAGAVVGLIFHASYGNIGLDKVTVTIPQFSELEFTVSSDNRLIAWRLYIETTTRVSTQALEPDTGKLREAMNSLYSLFQAVRTSLAGAKPSRPGASGPKVEELGIAMLNRELRPFLSRWHPLLAEWEKANPDEPEREWPSNADCRAALNALQQNLGSYAAGFARLAGLDISDELDPVAAGGAS
jgi:hypothetical protein